VVCDAGSSGSGLDLVLTVRAYVIDQPILAYTGRAHDGGRRLYEACECGPGKAPALCGRSVLSVHTVHGLRIVPRARAFCGQVKRLGRDGPFLK